MMKQILLILLISTLQLSAAVDITYNGTNVLSEEGLIVNNKYNFEVIVNNSEDNQIIIRGMSLITNNDDVSLGKSIYNLDPFSSKSINLMYNPKHNVFTYGFLTIEYEELGEKKNSILEIDLKPNYENEYYSSTQNLYGKDLIEELRTIVSQQEVFFYRDARIVMWEELNNKDGIVECVYTGRTIQHTDGIPSVQETRFNTEHTWPRAFGSADEPPLSDMHHIFPTFEVANSRRSNSQFGLVAGEVYWEEGGSQLGKNESGKVIFEPRDVHKGDVARALFYFSLRYGNQDQFLTPQEDLLRQWHLEDEVNEDNIRRNEIIFREQKNRNPFIDIPDILERIPSLANEDPYPLTTKIVFSSDTLTFNNNLKNTLSIYLTNIGNSFTSLSDFNIEGDFELLSPIGNLNPDPGIINEIQIQANNENANGKLTVEYSNGEIIEVTLISKLSTSVKIIEDQLFYPNPSRNGNFKILSPSVEVLNVFNLLGENINYTILNGNLFIGTTGAYIVSYRKDSKIYTQKLLIR